MYTIYILYVVLHTLCPLCLTDYTVFLINMHVVWWLPIGGWSVTCH